MQAQGQVSMGMSCPKAQSLANRRNHTVGIFNQLEAGSLPLERVVLKENHLYWKVCVLRLPLAVLLPHPIS